MAFAALVQNTRVWNLVDASLKEQKDFLLRTVAAAPFALELAPAKSARAGRHRAVRQAREASPDPLRATAWTG